MNRAVLQQAPLAGRSHGILSTYCTFLVSRLIADDEVRDELLVIFVFSSFSQSFSGYSLIDTDNVSAYADMVASLLKEFA